MANKTVYPYGTGGQLPSSIGLVNDLKTGGVDKALTAEQGKVIGEMLFEERTYPSDNLTPLSSYNNKQFKADSSQNGKSLSSVPTYTQSGSRNYRIPVKGAYSVTYRKFNSGYEYGCLFLDASDVVVQGVVSTTSDPNMRTVGIPTNAVSFIWSYIPSLVDDENERVCTVQYIKTEELDTRITDAEAAIEELIDSGSSGGNDAATNTLVTGKSPAIKSGRFGENGNLIANQSYVYTETIFGGFSLILAEGWRVYEGHLYDRKGNMVSYRHINPNVRYTSIGDTWSGRVYMAIDNTVPDYGIRLVLCKSDQSAIANGEMPVSNFVLLGENSVKRWVPDDLPNYGRAQRRIDYLQHLRWTALAKVPDGVETPTNANFCLSGQVHVGVPYSDVAETRTYVPNNVSLRTFMTAVRNRRSLLYTEDLLNNVSKYGNTYKTGVRSSYYGTVCCGFTNWVMGSDVMYLSGEYGADRVPGLSAVQYNSVNDLRPLDLVWYDGHISMISDIYKDEYGEVKYIVWAEMRAPYPYKTPYTPEQFNARVVSSNSTIHRWNGWANIQEPEASEYSQYLLGETRKEPKYNEDIMCFAGDYAAFADGSKIHLNARRKSVYTGVELYKDNVLLQTIDITGLSADSIVTPNTEDWVDVNLTTLNLAAGKYKARMTDGANTTDYTYFEIIGITMSATKSGNTVTIAFGSSNGTPVSVEQVKDNGFPNTTSGKYHAITSEEIQAGTMTLNWAYNSTYKYLLMLVRGDYGTVAKRISHPSA